MKVLIVCALFVAVALARPDGEFYDNKFDDFDADALVANERLLKGYVQCLLGKGSCTAEGKAFKKIIPEALETDCAKCSPKQRVLIRKIATAARDKLPEDFAELVKIYDPESKYVEEFKKFLDSTD